MDNVRQTFNDHYEAYKGEILRYVSLRLRDIHAVEDVTATVFVRYFEKLLRGDVIENPRALLYHMVRGAVIDEYRKSDRRKTVELTEYIASLFVSDDLARETDTALDYARILSMLDTLKPEYRDIILLHYVEDRSIGEIAQMLGETENTTRVRLHRALAATRKRLNHE